MLPESWEYEMAHPYEDPESQADYAGGWVITLERFTSAASSPAA